MPPVTPSSAGPAARPFFYWHYSRRGPRSASLAESRSSPRPGGGPARPAAGPGVTVFIGRKILCKSRGPLWLGCCLFIIN